MVPAWLDESITSLSGVWTIEMPVKMTMLVRRFYEEIINNAEFD